MRKIKEKIDDLIVNHKSEFNFISTWIPNKRLIGRDEWTEYNKVFPAISFLGKVN